MERKKLLTQIIVNSLSTLCFIILNSTEQQNNTLFNSCFISVQHKRINFFKCA